MEKIEDSLKGVLLTVSMIAIFITCIINFIIIFPQEQGATFDSASDQHAYLNMSSVSIDSEESLNSIDNSSNNAYNDWDITQGFMGSNTLKQSSTGTKTYSNNIFKNLILMANLTFGENSPVLWVLGILSILTGVYLTYILIKWIRTGN